MRVKMSINEVIARQSALGLYAVGWGELPASIAAMQTHIAPTNSSIS